MEYKIPLGGQYGAGRFALVDKEDHAHLSQFNWFQAGPDQKFRRYALAWVNGEQVLMHRLIMDAPAGMVVDHINGDTLDNRRKNLRLATTAQNNRNRRPSKFHTLTSPYKGVSYHVASGLWAAQISVEKEVIWLGTFATQWEAAKAYNNAAVEHFGRWAQLNRIPDQPGPDDPPLRRKAQKRVRNPKLASKYKGVRRGGRKWQAYINVDGEFVSLGQYPDQRLAGLVYDAAALKYFGNATTLNFPEKADNPIDIDRPIVLQAKPRRGGTNPYLGIKQNTSGKWIASIGMEGGRVNLGLYTSPEEAARAYDAAAYEKGGRVIYLNFPDGYPNHIQL